MQVVQRDLPTSEDNEAQSSSSLSRSAAAMGASNHAEIAVRVLVLTKKAERIVNHSDPGQRSSIFPMVFGACGLESDRGRRAITLSSITGDYPWQMRPERTRDITPTSSRRCSSRPENMPEKMFKKTDDPKARALFEVTAEVLDGLTKAFRDYEDKSEPAWR